MSSFKLAARYAKSLLDLALEKNQLEAVTADVQLFRQVCLANRELVLMLRNPIVHADKKQKVIDLVFGTHFHEITKAFFRLIISKSREAYLPQFAESYMEAYNRLNHITRVTLTTPVEADAALTDTVKKLLKEKAGLEQIEFTTRVEPALIGGFKLQYEDKLYDASLLRKLETLDDSFLENQYLRKI